MSSTSFFRQKNYKNNLPQKQKPITQNSAKSGIANLIVPYLVHIASTAIAIDKPANYILMSIVTIEVKYMYLVTFKNWPLDVTLS